MPLGGLADGYLYSRAAHLSPLRPGTAPMASQDARAARAMADSLSMPRRCRHRVVDQEAGAWPDVGPLPVTGWPIIESAVPVPPIMCELSMKWSIWG